MIKWQGFPKSWDAKSVADVKCVIDAFEKHYAKIESPKMNLKSNEVLEEIEPDLSKGNFEVEKDKSNVINVDLLFGENGLVEKSFNPDALSNDKKTIVEVEAGRAWANFQFLKDVFEASMMPGVEYLVIAVRQEYVAGSTTSADYEKIKKVFETVYSQSKLVLPLKGIVLIGY